MCFSAALWSPDWMDKGSRQQYWESVLENIWADFVLHTVNIYDHCIGFAWQGFSSGGLQGWLMWEAAGSFPYVRRSQCHSLQDRPTAGQGQVHQQTMEQTTVRWDGPLQPTQGGADISLQPGENPTPEQGDARRRLWPHEKPTLEQGPGRTSGAVKRETHAGAGLLAGLATPWGTYHRFLPLNHTLIRILINVAIYVEMVWCVGGEWMVWQGHFHFLVLLT